jgi:hypothetical protein
VDERSTVELPPHVQGRLEVYLNGVRQEHGRDYVQEGRTLVFERPLEREGKLGFWRWTSMFLGIAGTYRRDDKVDVIYDSPGGRLVETGLRFERG